MFRDLVDWLRDTVRDALHRRGYEEAADVCVGVVTARIEDLTNRLGSLSKEDQSLLRTLDELRSEMETKLVESWDADSTEDEAS